MEQNQIDQKPGGSSNLLALKLICLSMMSTVVMLGCLPLLMKNIRENESVKLEDDPIISSLLIAAIVLLVSAAPVGRLFLKPIAPEDRLADASTLASYMTARIVTFAMWESVAICGFLIYTLGHSMSYCAMCCAAAFGAMIVFFPWRKE